MGLACVAGKRFGDGEPSRMELGKMGGWGDGAEAEAGERIRYRKKRAGGWMGNLDPSWKCFERDWPWPSHCFVKMEDEREEEARETNSQTS